MLSKRKTHGFKYIERVLLRYENKYVADYCVVCANCGEVGNLLLWMTGNHVRIFWVAKSGPLELITVDSLLTKNSETVW